MSIPTSLIVVLLVVAWLVVLVPMIAKRRDKVPRAQSGGNGFRVLRRAQASLKRRPRRAPEAGTPAPDAVPDAAAPAQAQASTVGRERTLVTVGAPAAAEPRDAAEDWAEAHAGYQPAATPEPVEYVDGAEPAPTASQWDQPPTGTDPGEPEPTVQDGYDGQGVQTHDQLPDGRWPGPQDPSVTAFPYESPRIPNEVDEHEWAEHAAATSAPRRSEVDDDALRPTPRRRGRGGYDPEAAEATRAYRYRQRRRVTLVLAAATVLFTLVALLLASWLWVGAAISVLLLALYLAYLRRQVRIEAQIRQRRMERLQRARQIRPEYGRGRPPVRGGRSAAGPGRAVVDLDDDDPGFDHLEPYDPPVTYRRAAGQ